MSKNQIADEIADQIQKDGERLKAKYTELWAYLDTTELTKHEKDGISDKIERIVYLVERQSIQKIVQDTNANLSTLYWACQPSDPKPYYMHKYEGARV